MRKPVTFLIVDDEPAAVRQICHLARALGYEATPAISNAEARGIINGGSRYFDCAIVDVRMPGEDGSVLQAELSKRGTDAVLYTCNPALVHGTGAEVYEKTVTDARDLLHLLAERAPAMRSLAGIKSNTQELRLLRQRISEVI